MPSVRCPRCGKKFKDQTSLLQHMNQPFSSCLMHFEECIDITTNLSSVPTISESDDAGQQSFEPSDFMDTAEGYFASSLPADTSQNPKDSDTRNPFNITKHPTSGSVYGCGETFMDRCDKDKFAERRKGNIYYPFASRDEWELASFLLRSTIRPKGWEKATPNNIKNKCKFPPFSVILYIFFTKFVVELNTSLLCKF
jgi:hypothetical protein